MGTLLRRPLVLFGLLLVGVTTSQALATVSPQTRDSVSIRGQQQTVSIYGRRGGQPIVVSSGDGGWIHLGPRVAEYLASQGFFVVGFDARAYLEGFTSGHAALKPEDEPGDFKVLADWAAQGTSRKPILVGVSEGAGLSLCVRFSSGATTSAACPSSTK
jgi:type IV secretory pathway VirJ component